MNTQRKILKKSLHDDDDNQPVLDALESHAKRFEASNGDLKKSIGEQGDTISDMREKVTGMEQEFAEFKAGLHPGSESSGTSCLKPFMESEQLAAMRDGQNSTGRVMLKGAGIKLLAKAISAGGQSGDDNVSLPAERWGGLGNAPMGPLSLVQAMPVLPVSAGSFEYMILQSYTNAAAVQVKQGDAKAEGSLPNAVVTANIATIAHYMVASNQVLSDAPALAESINRLLRFGVVQKLESEIINGPASTAGRIAGLLALGTDATTTASDPADIIGQAITELQATGYVPSVVVLNPSDWFAIQSVRGDTEGAYLMGSPRDPAPPSLWSVPVVLSPALAAGTAIVMDASQTSILDREQPTVAISRSDSDNFTTNQSTILAELRAGLAVFSPSAVLVADLTPST